MPPVTPASSTIRQRAVNHAEAAECAGRFADLAYTQEPGYALEAAARVGARAEFFVFDNGEREPVGYAALRVKAIPLLGGGLAYLHGGPATRRQGEAHDEGLFASCLAELARHCAARHLTLRVSPPGYDSPDGSFRPLGFVPSGASDGPTIVLDLTPSLEDLRGRLAGKWRTDLNRGERGALRIVPSAEPPDIAKVQPLLSDLAERKGFGVAQDAAFFARAAARGAAGEPPFVAHLAYMGEELVAGHIGAYTGDTAVYLLGAANPAGREVRAAFVLQWAVIAYAKARGLTRYDLGGIDRAANPDVYRFKARMGGIEVERPAVWEQRSGALRPALIALAERVRR